MTENDKQRRTLLTLFAASLTFPIVGCGGGNDTVQAQNSDEEDDKEKSVSTEKQAFAIRITKDTPSPSIYAPMANLRLSVPGAEYGDTYSVKFRIDGKYTALVPADFPLGSKSIRIALPPGKLTASGFQKCSVGIRIYRTRNGQSSSVLLRQR